jgi:hypothetical protein
MKTIFVLPNVSNGEQTVTAQNKKRETETGTRTEIMQCWDAKRRNLSANASGKTIF